ncbi:hypothetical protein P20652_0037 [Pseudoalteromonas sp. BSi20652]|nr:hypothetical protein P20652_0037 [Pseudoalteromonas sp. BSi20652]
MGLISSFFNDLFSLVKDVFLARKDSISFLVRHFYFVLMNKSYLKQTF